jgi:hypothetical protein
MGSFLIPPTFNPPAYGILVAPNGAVLTVSGGVPKFLAPGGGGGGFTGAYISTAVAAGANNNVNPGGAPAWPGTLSAPYGQLDLTGAAGDFNLTGLLAGLNLQQVVIRNATNFNGTLNDQNAGSLAANRFAIGGAGDTLLPAGVSILAVYYAGSINRWVIVS